MKAARRTLGRGIERPGDVTPYLHQTHTLGLSVDEQPVEIASGSGLAGSVTQGAVPEGQVPAAFQGQIDDVRIYGEALSQAQIQQIAQ